MNSIKIKNFTITENQRPMFVAEISGNHNQKLSYALKLIKKAKEAGADAVKFQYFKADDLVTKKATKPIITKNPNCIGLNPPILP